MDNDFWTGKREADLLKFKQAGLSASQIGLKLGCTRNAVIGKIHRLAGTVFAGDVRRAAEERDAARFKEAERLKRERAAIKAMKAAIRAGMDRGQAIDAAVESGATFPAIGRELGFSQQRAHQLACRWRDKAA